MNSSKNSENKHFLISRSKNIAESDLIPTPKGRTREETKKLLLKQFEEAITKYKANLKNKDIAQK